MEAGEKTGIVRLTVRVPSQFHEKLIALSAMRSKSINALINQLIATYIDREFRSQPTTSLKEQ
jgi:predicted HicB family RNase H-like nuclease